MKYFLLFCVVSLIGCSAECGGAPPPAPLPAPTPVVIVPGPAPQQTFGVDRYGAKRQRMFAAPQQEYEYRLVPVVRPTAPRAATPCQQYSAPRAAPDCVPCPDDGGVTPPGPGPVTPVDPNAPDPLFDTRRQLPIPPPPPPASQPSVR